MFLQSRQEYEQQLNMHQNTTKMNVIVERAVSAVEPHLAASASQ